MPVAEGAPTVDATLASNISGKSSGIKQPKKVFTAKDIPFLYAKLRNSEKCVDSLLEALQGFRRLLSLAENPPVKDVIDCGALPIFVQLLQYPDDRMKFEAAWALTNVASSDLTPVVVEIGAVPSLVQLLLSSNADVREQSAWCLGNIAGDSPALRDEVLHTGSLAPLLQNILQPSTKSLLGNCVWTLSNFCRGKPHVDLNHIKPAIPVLAKLLNGNKEDGGVLVDVCWALSYLSDGSEDRIQAVIDAGVIPDLITMLESKDVRKITPALRTLGNCVSGNDIQTQAVIDGGVLRALVGLLEDEKKNIRKESCWLISNIAAGTHNQIDTLVRSTHVMKKVIAACSASEWEVRKEAAWVCSNIATGGTEHHAEIMVNLGGITAMCAMLESSDTKILLVVLEAIEKILSIGEKNGRGFPSLIDENGGVEKIEKLQEHENDDIYNKCVKIIETYFNGEEVDDENIAPTVQNNEFKFGVTQVKNLDADMSAVAEPSAPQQYNFSF